MGIMRELDQIYWLRVFLGTAAGFLSGHLGFLETQPGRAVMLAIALYFASYYIARRVIYVNVPPQEMRKLAINGIGSYSMLFLFSWILYNTWLNLSSLVPPTLLP